MTKISKKIAAVVLIISLLTSLLTGCGREQKNENTVTDVPSQTTPTQTIDITATPTPEIIQTGIQVYGQDAELIMSEDWHDYIGRLDVFVYGLIANEFGQDYDIFPAGVVLPDGREVCGIAYTDYTEYYENDAEKYVAVGFLPAIGEDGITKDELDSGLLIDAFSNASYSYSMILSYQSNPYKDHCVIYGQYLVYGIDNNGCIFFENTPYIDKHCDESLGALYSFDEARYLFDPNLGEFQPLTGNSLNELISFAELEKEVNEILETQDLSFEQTDVESSFFIAQESVMSYLLSLQEETFLGYDVADLVQIAGKLNPNECIRITEEGLIALTVEPNQREASTMMKWIVGACTVTVIIAGTFIGKATAAAFKKTKDPKYLALSSAIGAVQGVAANIFMQVVVNSTDIRDLDYISISMAAVEGAISGALYSFLYEKEGLRYDVADTIVDGFLGGIDQFIYAKRNGEDWKKAGKEFVNGFVIAVSISAGLKILSYGLSTVGEKTGKARTGKLAKAEKAGKRVQTQAKNGLKKAEEVADISPAYAEKVASELDANQIKNSVDRLPKDAKYMDAQGNQIDKKQLRTLAEKAQEGQVLGTMKVGRKTRSLYMENSTVTPDLRKDAIATIKIPNISGNRDKNLTKAAKTYLEEFTKDKRKIPKVIKEYLEKIGMDIEDLNAQEFRKILTDCGYVLHECVDLETVMIIPIDVHEAFKHAGGVSAAKAKAIEMGAQAIHSIADLASAG